MNRTTQVPASGSPVQETLGGFKYFIIRSATAAVQVSFDGNVWHDAEPNDLLNPTDASRVYLRSTNSVAATVVFSYSKTPLSVQDTATSSASVTPQGNLGIANGAAAANGLPACDANGFLSITNGMLLKLAGTSPTGNRRQILILSVSANGAALQVLISATVGFMSIAPGSSFPLVTDSDFYISGSGGTAKVTIGEFYLKNA